MSHNLSQSDLAANKKRAIRRMLEGATKTQAAAAAGVTRRTLHRWLNEPEFAEILRRTSDRELQGAAAQYAGVTDSALSVMREIMEDPEQKAHARLRAADLILSHTYSLKEIDDLIDRIDYLEAILHELKASVDSTS